MKKTALFLLVLILSMASVFAQPVLKAATATNEYSIIYELYGGTNASANKDSYTENATVTLAAPARSGYKFDGWYWDEGLKNPVENNTFNNKKGALKVYAKWLKQMDFASFEAEVMVEIIPADMKVTLEDFAGTKVPQDIFAYSIGKYEVTQALYQAVTGTNPSYHKGENLPVENVTWYDAVYFCNELTKMTLGEENCCYKITDIERNDDGNITSAKVSWDKKKNGFRLPTESEWEMAARGGVAGGWDFKYSGSENIEEAGWYEINSKGKTHAVGTKKANMAGLYDMTGNVTEWCWNIWPSWTSCRVCRGGSWNSYNGYCTVDFSFSSNPDRTDPCYGFRICRGL